METDLVTLGATRRHSAAPVLKSPSQTSSPRQKSSPREALSQSQIYSSGLWLCATFTFDIPVAYSLCSMFGVVPNRQSSRVTRHHSIRQSHNQQRSTSTPAHKERCTPKPQQLLQHFNFARIIFNISCVLGTYTNVYIYIYACVHACLYVHKYINIYIYICV